MGWGSSTKKMVKCFYVDIPSFTLFLIWYGEKRQYFPFISWFPTPTSVLGYVRILSLSLKVVSLSPMILD